MDVSETQITTVIQLNARQDQLLDDLLKLNSRIESLIEQHTQTRREEAAAPA